MMNTKGGDDVDCQEYCEEIIVFNNENELNNLKLCFEELNDMMERDQFDNDNRSIYWKFDEFSCQHLRNLTLSNVKLKNINFIKHCSLLKSLNISFNQIRDIRPIENMTQLVVLDMSHNKIINVEHVKGLSQLEILRCHKNYIQSIESFNSLLELQELWMSNNEVNWTEFIHFSKLQNLSHIVLEKNTCDDKPKFLEFLMAICPSILTIDGKAAIQYLPKASRIDKNWYNPSEFLKTTDGRIMLTQAKALLNESQREFFNNHKIGDQSIRRFLLENTVIESPEKIRRTSLDSISENTSDNISNEIRSTRSEGGEPGRKSQNIKYYKAHRHKGTPKKYVQEYAQLRKSIEQEESQLLNYDAANSSLLDNNVKDLEVQRAQLIATPATLIRFGETSSSAVALSLHEDGTGYARYVKSII